MANEQKKGGIGALFGGKKQDPAAKTYTAPKKPAVVLQGNIFDLQKQKEAQKSKTVLNPMPKGRGEEGKSH